MDFTPILIRLNPPDVPMVLTNYYKWLGAGCYSGHQVDDNMAYLHSLGFTVGVDYLVPRGITTLDYIHQHYFYTTEVKK